MHKRSKYFEKNYRVYKDIIAGGGDRRLRRCLGCGRDFMSIGKGNRICNKCSKKDNLEVEFEKEEALK